MRKLLLAVAFLAAVMVTFATGSSAVTNGQPDNGRHPYVGLMVALDKDGVPLWRCSGSLLSPTVFLTAGHCTEAPAAHIEIWFEEGPILTDPDYAAAQAASPNPVSCNASPDFDGYPCQGDVGGTPYPNPDFCIGCGGGLPGFDYRDVGVVVLDEPVATSVVGEYASLPSAGLVDTLAKGTFVDLVGYGVSQQLHGGGPPVWTGPRVRLFAPTQLVSGQFVHSSEFIRLTANPALGKGGTCFGDSGGPDLLGGTSTVLAVNSYVTNGNCAGVTYSQRIDIPEVLAWIESFL
jgi:Trypsin